MAGSQLDDCILEYLWGGYTGMIVYTATQVERLGKGHGVVSAAAAVVLVMLLLTPAIGRYRVPGYVMMFVTWQQACSTCGNACMLYPTCLSTCRVFSREATVVVSGVPWPLPVP